MNGTSGRQRVQVNQLKQYIVAIDNQIMCFFDSAMKPIFGKIKLNVLEENKLSYLRDSLLPKLISGDIRVSI